MLAFGTEVCRLKPSRSRRIFRAKKILSTPSFAGEVKLSAPCRGFTSCKRSLNVTWISAFRQNLRDISRPQLHLPPLGAVTWRRLVTKVGTSSPDRTIRLKRLQCVAENKHKKPIGEGTCWAPNLVLVLFRRQNSLSVLGIALHSHYTK
jgi:hypothetical protein